MKKDLYEKLHEIIAIIGEDRVTRVYHITGSEKVSFACLYRMILLDQVLVHLQSGDSIKQIARHFGISRMTVYRIFKRYVRKSQIG